MIEDLAKLATILVIVGVTVGLGSLILGEIGNITKTQQDSKTYEAIDNSKKGLSYMIFFILIALTAYKTIPHIFHR